MRRFSRGNRLAVVGETCVENASVDTSAFINFGVDAGFIPESFALRVGTVETTASVLVRRHSGHITSVIHAVLGMLLARSDGGFGSFIAIVTILHVNSKKGISGNVTNNGIPAHVHQAATDAASSLFLLRGKTKTIRLIRAGTLVPDGFIEDRTIVQPLFDGFTTQPIVCVFCGCFWIISVSANKGTQQEAGREKFHDKD